MPGRLLEGLGAVLDEPPDAVADEYVHHACMQLTQQGNGSTTAQEDLPQLSLMQAPASPGPPCPITTSPPPHAT
jgi:hypothetical protein